MAVKSRAGSGWLWLVILIAAAAWTPAKAGAQQSENVRAVCAQCHPGRNAASRKLEGPHGREATCLSCHHAQGAGKPAESLCAKCHDKVAPSHAGVTGKAPGCTSCHSIHEDATKDARQAASARCRTCHEAPHGLHANAAKGPQCADCHTSHGGDPSKLEGPALNTRCASCHEAAHPSHPKSGERAPQCTSCHTLAKNGSTISGAQLASTCQGCHEETSSTHAHAQAKDGTRRTPACTDCHSFVKDPPVQQAGVAISQRCGACHASELEQYRKGGHKHGMTEAASERPTCASCHDEHSQLETRLSATAQCVKCHSSERLAKKYNLPDNVGASYTDDFHGATVQLLANNPETGKAKTDPVLVCADCHGAHDVGSMNAVSVSSVCLRCHESGDKAIAGAWLGHARVTFKSQPLIWAVRLFYMFTIPFVLFGLLFNIIFHYRDQHRAGHRIHRSETMQRIRARLAGKPLPPAPYVIRFKLSERLEHLGSMLTFITLVVTGLPQTRPDLGISNAIIGSLGGIGNTRLIHRTTGVIFVALMLMHVTKAVFMAIVKKRTPVMVPDQDDFVDTLALLRSFLDGGPKPKLGKFDFSEKFEYWGLFLGGVLMSVTGVILLYPELVTRVLPGQLVAMFRVMHGLEGTFAVSVVVLWHSYGVMLRPEVFPLDTSIFTGKMTIARLKHEHGREYERLFPEEAAREAAEEADAGAHGDSQHMARAH